MSKYVDIEPIIENIYEKWGCDPAYYVGVSGADAHEAKLDADLLEFLQSKPSIDIVRCKECKWASRDCEWCLNPESRVCGDDATHLYIDPNWYCADGERKEKANDTNTSH